jgi:hypothetical protein
MSLAVIRAKAGIQYFQRLINTLDSGFHRSDAFLGIHQFRVLKKSCDRLCRGPGAGTERAGSIGWASPLPRRSEHVSAGGGGGYLPASSKEKSAPHDSKRAGLTPGPWNHLALTTFLFSKG